MTRILLIAASLLLSAQAPAQDTDATGASNAAFAPWKASYSLTRGPLTLGHAEFELVDDDGQNCHVYRYDAKPVGLARLFIGQLHEVSEFCVRDGVIRTQRFEFRRDDEPEDNFVLNFDWDALTVTGPGDKERQIPEDAMDRLAIQLAVRDLLVSHPDALPTEPRNFTMIEDDRIKTYTMQVKGREVVKTPAGELQAIRVERVKDPSKTTIFWVAPELGYIPVRVEQRKNDSEVLSIALRKLPELPVSVSANAP
ncbi:DUF3108 domain-containing protein [uncultured Abyssibacter sp.]|uniref:DUF3108 domain-containing protein n=1 Tax=uncultured Abyssibacter sp. TaxID=2320202 RepID=UPI0032B2CC91